MRDLGRALQKGSLPYWKVPRIVLAPGLLTPESEPDLLPHHNRIPALRAARVRRLTFGDPQPPEALWLGLAPGEGEMAPGPLRVAALKEDPPERSTHFCLSYLTGTADALGSPQETDEFRALLSPLLRGPFRLLAGENGADALVWERLGAFQTRPPEEVAGKPLTEAMPDGEPWIRRFGDDSANLFLDAEPNRARRGEGRPEILLAWPWGHGVRLPVPSLPLRLGRPLNVTGGPEAFRGLARLAGATKKGDAWIVVLEDAVAWRNRGGFEELEARLLAELLPRLEPLLDDPKEPTALILPDAWTPTKGLWLSLLPNAEAEGEPRREMLRERSVPTQPIPRAITKFHAMD